jgi:hypothetical protein
MLEKHHILLCFPWYPKSTVASALELAAEALKLSANTSGNPDQLEQDITGLEGQS